MLLLITGATGKVGTNLVKRILSDPEHAGTRIRALCHNRSMPASERVEIVRGDIADREAVYAAMTGLRMSFTSRRAKKSRNSSWTLQ